MKNIWQEIKKPILLLSPMAGYTDSAFRLICKQQGANLLMTELISADAIAHLALKFKIKEELSSNPTIKLAQFQKAEMPIIIQFFGKNPEKFAIAAKWIEENLAPSGIDINMGCPAKKVVGSDHGATLLRDQDRGVEVVKTVRAATKLPLSVKTRLGWEKDDEILAFAPKLAEAGVDAIIIHGRTYKDQFSASARWENIYKVCKIIKSAKSKVHPVKIIGNGDIKKYQDIQDKLKNLDGVAIGRGAIGNPFIFNPKFVDLKEDEKLKLKKDTASEQAKLAFESKGKKGVIELRKHLLTYFKGLPEAKKIRMRFVQVENIDDVVGAIEEIKI